MPADCLRVHQPTANRAYHLSLLFLSLMVAAFFVLNENALKKQT
jgi:hypothetical protein